MDGGYSIELCCTIHRRKFAYVHAACMLLYAGAACILMSTLCVHACVRGERYMSVDVQILYATVHVLSN